MLTQSLLGGDTGPRQPSCLLSLGIFKHGFVDELIITIAPYILGGSNSKTLVEGDGFKNLVSATKLKLKKIQKINNELIVFYKT